MCKDSLNLKPNHQSKSLNLEFSSSSDTDKLCDPINYAISLSIIFFIDEMNLIYPL